MEFGKILVKKSEVSAQDNPIVEDARKAVAEAEETLRRCEESRIKRELLITKARMHLDHAEYLLDLLQRYA